VREELGHALVAALLELLERPSGEAEDREAALACVAGEAGEGLMLVEYGAKEAACTLP
jgi:hypothetical protein